MIMGLALPMVKTGLVAGGVRARLAAVEAPVVMVDVGFPAPSPPMPGPPRTTTRTTRSRSSAASRGAGGKVLVATGYSKWGMANAIAAGLRLSATILGGSKPPSAVPLERRITRPSHVATGLRTGIGVAVGAALGWAAAEASALSQSPPGEGTGRSAGCGGSRWRARLWAAGPVHCRRSVPTKAGS